MWSADNGDGTYTNPVINADAPDIDVVRVGDTYYMVTTTMFVFPGATIFKSKDLVNWEFCANPLTKLGDGDGWNLLNGKNFYSRGQWASSIKYHNGKFYIHFIAFGDQDKGFDGGGYLLTATDPEGEWTMKKVDGYYDNGVLFDDGPNGDGNTYIAYGINELRVSQIDPDTWKAKKTEIFYTTDKGCEGCHMYHIGDYYYIYATYNSEASQTIFRSKNPMGPYEEHNGRIFNYNRIHQGALIDTPTGEWWTLLFRDAGSIGRIPYLEPVKWVDGWPVLGNNGIDVSKSSAKYRKPNVGKEYPKTYLITNDPFSQPKLGIQWAWNHNPMTSFYSLTERPGYLRLKTNYKATTLTQARNTLTQRIVGYSPEGTSSANVKPNYGTAKFDVSGMKNGDVCGLCVFQENYGYIGVKMENDKKYIVQYINDFDSKTLAETKGPELTSDIVYLRAVCRLGSDMAYFYYSLDNKKYTKLGNNLSMVYTLRVFMGNRFGLFNYRTGSKLGGYVDIDWFTTEGGTFEEENYYTEDYLYPDGKTDGIQDASVAASSGKPEYYSLSGVRQASPQHGFNIVRYPDGTTNKVFYGK